MDQGRLICPLWMEHLPSRWHKRNAITCSKRPHILIPYHHCRTPPKALKGTNSAEWLLQHIKCMFPLWDKQKQLLHILNDDRKQYHGKLKSKKQNMKDFHPGDLVIIKKQVKTFIVADIYARLMIQARGPYRVIEKLVHPTKSNESHSQKDREPKVRYSRSQPHEWSDFHPADSSSPRRPTVLELEIKHKHDGFNINYEKATVVSQQFGFGL
jgi:hypothetical protein